jgi:hypothetical protein
MLALPLDRTRGARLSVAVAAGPDRPAHTVHVLVDGRRVGSRPLPITAEPIAVDVPPDAIRRPMSHVVLGFGDWSRAPHASAADGRPRVAAVEWIDVQ